MAVIVLGAGATRGASFVETEGIAAGRVCLPPLDRDFFTQLQRVAKPLHQPVIDAVIKDAVSLFGINFRVTLESMFTTVEQLLAMHAMRPSGGTATDRARFEECRRNLLQALAAVFEESLTTGEAGTTGYSMRECTYHGRLVQSLKPKDAIVSLNYDCLIDTALRSHGDGKWNARFGYALSLPPHNPGPNALGESAWNPSVPATQSDTIRLFKLHGSLHFRRASPKEVRLKARPYSHMREGQALQFEIIPPESHKRLDDPIFHRIWSGAASALHVAKTLVFIGYSFPDGDVHTAAFFRLRGTGSAGRLRNLVVVNPDSAARRRTIDILRASVDKTTRILVFDKLGDFVGAKRTLWDR